MEIVLSFAFFFTSFVTYMPAISTNCSTCIFFSSSSSTTSSFFFPLSFPHFFRKIKKRSLSLGFPPHSPALVVVTATFFNLPSPPLFFRPLSLQDTHIGGRKGLFSFALYNSFLYIHFYSYALITIINMTPSMYMY